MSRMRRYLVAVVVGLVAVAAGSAYAATSESSGKITVCVKRSDGLLYRSKSCHSGDSKLSWNARGPVGEKGSNGKSGAPGKPGTDGTNGTSGKDGTNGINGTNGTNGAVADYAIQELRGEGLLVSPPGLVLTENLPAGSFLVTAKLNYVFASDSSSTSNGFASGSCTLSDGPATDPSTVSQYVEGTNAGEGTEEGESPMSMQLALSETVGTTVSLTCAVPTGATTMALIDDADLDAIQATQIVGSPSGT